MAKVTIPDLTLDEEITSAEINTFITSINALPNNLNDDNVREQGIDRRNIALNAVTLVDDADKYLYKSNSDHAIATAGAGLTKMTDGVSSYPIGVGSGASGLITLANGEKMIVWASFEYHVVLNATHVKNRNSGDGAYEVWFQFGVRNSGGGTAYSALPKTLRKSNLILADRQSTVGGIPGKHFTPKASLTISTVIHNDTGGNQNYDVALLGYASRSIATGATIEAKVVRVQMFAKIVRK